MYGRILAGDLFPIEKVVETIVKESGYREMLAKDPDPRSADRLDNVQELISDARTREDAGGGNPLELSGWLEQIALVSDTDDLEVGAEAVKLMTLHSAKGLEFPAVFLTGMEDGVLPHARSIQGEGDLEEERRLCYVGMTRAKLWLTLSLARHREQFGSSHRNPPSRFLAEIPSELCEVSDQSAGQSLGYGDAAFAQWFTGRPGNNATVRKDDNDDPFDFGEAPVEDGPANHLAAGRRETSVSPSEPSELHEGDNVRHGVFGVGRILNLTKTGRVRVHFQGWGEKNLAIEYAKLEKI